MLCERKKRGRIHRGFLKRGSFLQSRVVPTELWFQGRLGLHPAVKMSLSSTYVLTDPLLTLRPAPPRHCVSVCTSSGICLSASFYSSRKLSDKNRSYVFFFCFLLFPPAKCFVQVPPQVQIRQNNPPPSAPFQTSALIPPRHSVVSVWQSLHPLATSRFVSLLFLLGLDIPTVSAQLESTNGTRPRPPGHILL